MKRELFNPVPDSPMRGPVSRAVRVGDLVFTSGLSARDPVTSKLPDGPMQDHARGAIENLRRVLEAAGSGLDAVVSLTCYLSDIESEFEAWDAVYRELFPHDFPARTVVEAKMRGGLRIELQAVACVTRG